jgi:hypothetical protein
MMLKNTSAKENRGGKGTTGYVNETESEVITNTNHKTPIASPVPDPCPSEKLLQGG